MLLNFDIAPEAVDEHDDWHTHEHLPERLSIPGFLRGTRWTAAGGNGPRYCVLYEVEQLATLTSAAYLERLNQPTPWTSRMMPSYRGMVRGLCTVSGSFGHGLGGAALLVRLEPLADAASALRAWLLGELLPALPSRRGLGSAHLLESAAAPAMTAEQRIRGADAGVDWAVLVTGYDAQALSRLADGELTPAALAARNAAAVTQASYRLVHALTAGECR